MHYSVFLRVTSVSSVVSEFLELGTSLIEMTYYNFVKTFYDAPQNYFDDGDCFDDDFGFDHIASLQVICETAAGINRVTLRASQWPAPNPGETVQRQHHQ